MAKLVQKRSRDPSKEHRSGKKITTLHDPYLFCVSLSLLHHSSLPRNKIERTGEMYERFVGNRSETNGEIDRLCWRRLQRGNQSDSSPLKRGQNEDKSETARKSKDLRHNTRAHTCENFGDTGKSKDLRCTYNIRITRV